MKRLRFLHGAQRHGNSRTAWRQLSLATIFLTCGCKAPGDDGLFGVTGSAGSQSSGTGGAPMPPGTRSLDGGTPSSGPAPASQPLPPSTSTRDASTESDASTAQDASTSFDASTLGGGPVCPLASARDAGTTLRDAGAGAGDRLSCCGQFVSGLCWYLGEAGQSCTQTCSSHGGVDPRGIRAVGSQAQGGALSECTAVLESLLPALNAPVGAGTRDDNLGLGCHFFRDSETLWWLVDIPFSPGASQVVTSLACSCLQ